MLGEQGAHLIGGVIAPDDRDEPRLGSKGDQIADDVAGAAEHGCFPFDPQHGNGCLRRNTLDRPVDEAIQHDIADTQHASVGERPHQRQKVRTHAHAKPNSVSRAPQSI